MAQPCHHTGVRPPEQAGVSWSSPLPTPPAPVASLAQWGSLPRALRGFDTVARPREELSGAGPSHWWWSHRDIH